MSPLALSWHEYIDIEVRLRSGEIARGTFRRTYLPQVEIRVQAGLLAIFRTENRHTLFLGLPWLSRVRTQSAKY